VHSLHVSVAVCPLTANSTAHAK